MGFGKAFKRAVGKSVKLGSIPVVAGLEAVAPSVAKKVVPTYAQGAFNEVKNVARPAVPIVAGGVATFFGGPAAGAAAYQGANMAIGMIDKRNHPVSDDTSNYSDNIAPLPVNDTAFAPINTSTAEIIKKPSNIVIIGVIILGVVAFLYARK